MSADRGQACGTVLLLPPSGPGAAGIARDMSTLGFTVVAGGIAAARKQCPEGVEFVELPRVYDPMFHEAVAQLCADRQVRAIWSPHKAVRSALSSIYSTSSVALLGEDALDGEIRRWDEARAAVAKCAFAHDSQIDDDGRILIQSALLQALRIEGESDAIKLVEMGVSLLRAPPGLAVEVGVLFGRSAVLMAIIARQARSRPVLFVDPFALEHAVQDDSPAPLRAGSHTMSWSTVGAIARANLLGAGAREDALFVGTSAEAVESSAISPVAFLHIDGNHDESAVRDDWGAWRPHLVVGATVIFDDYDWVGGTGPKVVADELLNAGVLVDARLVGRSLFARFHQRL